MPFSITLIGGPDDGQAIESDHLPEVIDGDSFHFFGTKAYVLAEVDYDKKIAIYEHIKIGGKMDEGDIIESDGIQSPDS